MSAEMTDTTIALGATDGYRYIGIQPPLTDGEIEAMSAEGIFSQGSIEQIEMPAPACTVVRCAGDTEYASLRAFKIADFLTDNRDGKMRFLIAPVVQMIGHNSSPFNPNTDALRHR